MCEHRGKRNTCIERELTIFGKMTKRYKDILSWNLLNFVTYYMFIKKLKVLISGLFHQKRIQDIEGRMQEFMWKALSASSVQARNWIVGRGRAKTQRGFGSINLTRT